MDEVQSESEDMRVSTTKKKKTARRIAVASNKIGYTMRKMRVS